MSNQNKIILALLIFVVLLVLIFLFKGVIFKPEKPLVENDEFKLLSQTFPKKQITPQNDKGHYVIEGKDYYVKSIGDINQDGFVEFVSMEIIQDHGKTYKFYTKTANEYLLIGEEASLIWHLQDEKNKEMEFVLQDITGDGISEILIPILTSAGNVTPYHIFAFDHKTKKLKQIFEKSYFSDKPETYVIFDEISREGDFVVTTWHGTWSRGKSYYFVEDDILNFEKGVGAYWNPGIEGEYEYREIDKNGNVVYKETRQESAWTDSLSK